jgi:microcompartment protein CcmK/EutM
MFLAKVEGSVVSTKKDASMSGRKLLLLRPMLVDDKDPSRFKLGSNTVVAVDSVGAGEGEMVLFAREAPPASRPDSRKPPWTPLSSASSTRWMYSGKKSSTPETPAEPVPAA